jgi:hypothetical protein
MGVTTVEFGFPQVGMVQERTIQICSTKICALELTPSQRDGNGKLKGLRLTVAPEFDGAYPETMWVAADV